MLRVAVVGAGYMGQAHARVLSRIAWEEPELLELAYVVDVDPAKAKAVARKYGGKPLASIAELPRGSVDLAIIATPTATHRPVFESLVERGVEAFLIEKPMAHNLADAWAIASRAEEQSLWVAVGHIERYNPAASELARRVGRGWLGQVLSITARRVGPYTPRVQDTDVVYDLGVHEVDAIYRIMGGPPKRIRSYALSKIVTGLNDHAVILLDYGRTHALVEVNRLTPYKQRQMIVTGTLGVANLDYMNQELVIYRGDEQVRPLVVREEPLYLQDLDVVKRLLEGREPLVSAREAYAVLRLCELALESARLHRELEVPGELVVPPEAGG